MNNPQGPFYPGNPQGYPGAQPQGFPQGQQQGYFGPQPQGFPGAYPQGFSPQPPPKKSHTLAISLSIIALILLATGGFWFFHTHAHENNNQASQDQASNKTQPPPAQGSSQGSEPTTDKPQTTSEGFDPCTVSNETLAAADESFANAEKTQIDQNNFQHLHVTKGCIYTAKNGDGDYLISILMSYTDGLDTIKEKQEDAGGDGTSETINGQQVYYKAISSQGKEGCGLFSEKNAFSFAPDTDCERTKKLAGLLLH